MFKMWGRNWKTHTNNFTMMGCGEVTLTEKCEKVVAKKGLFGWKVREPQNPEVMQE